MDANQRVDPEFVLQNWRVRILNGFLVVVAIIVMAMTVVTVLDAMSRPGQWPAVIVYLILTMIMVGLAVFQGIDYRVRAWGTLVVPYIVGVMAMATFGLGSSGRLYMMAVPIAALILIGTRPGMIMWVVSILTIVLFANFANSGLLAESLIRDRNSLLLADWIAEFADTLGLLTIVMVILIMFYRFQESLITRERSTQAELLRTQKLLEEQNSTLEQKIKERTSELQDTNHNLEQRNAALAMLNSVSEAMTMTFDVKTIMQLVGDKIRGIFDVDSSMIMLIDRQTNMIHVPYAYDRNEGGYIEYVEPFPLGTGLSSKVIMTGQPLIANTVEDQVANGAYFPPEIIAKGRGAYSESWLGVPILSSDQVLGLIVLANNRPQEFKQNHVGLLQTLSSNLGAAIENARLFEAEQSRIAELQAINKVQEALASNLDVRAIYELIGERVREVFNVDVVDIVSYDPDTNTLFMPYSYEKGDRTIIDPHEAYGFRLHVINTREALLVNRNFRELAAKYDNPVLTGEWPKSALFAPLLVDGNVRSIISIQNLEKENAFRESDVRLLKTLANSMSVALENARLFDQTQHLLKETEQRNRELSIINNIQQGLASKLDFQAIIDLFGDEVSRIFSPQERIANNYSVYIALYEPQTQMIRFPYLIDGAGERFSEPPTPLGPGLTSFVIRSGQPLKLKNAEEQIEYGVINFTQINQVIGSQSWLGVPIRSGAQVIGVLSMQDQRPNLFTEADVRLLSTLAASLAVALENAHLFEEAQQRAAELAIINSVQAGLSSKLDMQAIYELVGEKIRNTFNSQVVTIAIYDRASQLMYGRYCFEDGKRMPDLSLPAFGFRKYVVEHRLPLMINENMAGWMKEYANPVVGGAEPKSAIFIPMMIGNDAMGVVSLQNNDHENAFSQSDVYLLTTLVNSMSVALENARLFNETQRLLKETEQRAAELATVNTVSSAITGELDLNALIQLVGEQIRTVFRTDIAYVALLDKETNIVNFPYQYGQCLESLQLGEGLTGRVIQSGAPLLINADLERQREQMGAAKMGKPALSYLGVPIFAGGEAIGVVSIQSTTQEGIFTQNEQHLLSTIAANVGIALQNARLFDKIKHQEQVARESAEKLRLIFETAFDGISIYEEIPEESRRILLDCNDRYCAMAGRSKAELLAIHDTRTIQRDLGVGTEVFGFEPIMAGRVFAGVFSWVRPDGRENIIEYNAAPTRVGGRYFTIGLDRDVTERKHYEDELERARAAAEQANQAKSAFLANMSHELRTPLNAIMGFTRIVRRKAEGVLPDKQTDNLDKVLTSADHLLNLINTVLDIAKIEAGRMDVLAANFRIDALMDLCANTVQPLLRPTVVLEKRVNESLAYVYSDQDKIRQIVLNLLSNAAKFTHAGKITLAASQDGEQLCILVSDTGIGMSAEALPRIFKEFQQAHNTTTRQYGGTGLGLSISRNLAHLLGGDLMVESELGKGSTFTLVIPIHYESKLAASHADREPLDQTPGKPAPAQEMAVPSERGFVKKCVLVIDDDPDAVYLVQENLNPQEYEILGAPNGADGLQMARNRQPDAILLDIVMPGADGWQVLHDLKADPNTSHIPVIFLTIVDNKALGLQLGAAAYLLKPLDPAEVRETLNRVINGALRPLHILVVDDDPNVADMLRQFLPESDFCLEWAPDGIAGLDAIDAHRPDILMLDLLMPRMDGFGVIEKLRADPKKSDLPIVVLSAKDLTAVESARLKKNVTCVVKKQGIEGRMLLDEINHALGQPLTTRASKDA
jgi:PAS domain S-box-containing protein